MLYVPNTLFVGIDVSSNSFEVAFLDDDGRQLGRSFSVANDLDGACKIGETVCLSAQAQEASDVRIGLESTSAYGWHLRDFLFDLDSLKKHSTLVYDISPSIVADFKKSFSRKPRRSFRLNSEMQDAVDVTLSLTLQNIEFLRS